MPSLLNKFVAASALTALTIIASVQTVESAETTANTPNEKSAEPAPNTPQLTEQQRINVLNFARLESAVIRSKVATLMRMSMLARTFAEMKEITPDICVDVITGDLQQRMSDFKIDYELSMGLEVKYGGRTAKDKEAQMKLINQASGYIDSDTSVARQECILQFGA